MDWRQWNLNIYIKLSEGNTFCVHCFYKQCVELILQKELELKGIAECFGTVSSLWSSVLPDSEKKSTRNLTSCDISLIFSACFKNFIQSVWGGAGVRGIHLCGMTDRSRTWAELHPLGDMDNEKKAADSTRNSIIYKYYGIYIY